MPEIDLRKRGYVLTTIGCVMIFAVLVLTAMVLFAKPQFGGLVGPRFLPVLATLLVFGSLAIFLGAWQLREGRRWQWIALYAWAVVALITPVFGYMFVLPLGLLAATLPLVVAALITLRHVSA